MTSFYLESLPSQDDRRFVFPKLALSWNLKMKTRMMLWRKSRDKWKVVTAELGVEHWQHKPSAPGVQFSTQIQSQAPLASLIYFASIVSVFSYLQSLSLSGVFWNWLSFVPMTRQHGMGYNVIVYVPGKSLAHELPTPTVPFCLVECYTALKDYKTCVKYEIKVQFNSIPPHCTYM